MKVAGIIAEYNPLHEGHVHHIWECRRLTGCDYLIVVMSGDFVQRGMPAVFDAGFRAEMALRAGADVVILLPVWASVSSAEGFAGGGVRLLRDLKLPDTICFGTESSDEKLLSECAAILATEPPEFRELLRDNLKSGLSFPRSRAEALRVLLPKSGELLSSPNNLLGVEYEKANLLLNAGLTPVPILRKGTAYHDPEVTSFCSATAIRNHLLIHREFPTEGILQEFRTLYQNRFEKQNRQFLTLEDFTPQIFHTLDGMNPDELQAYADISAPLSRRIANNCASCHSVNELSEILKTKDITRTAIDRAFCHILLSLKQSEMELYRSLEKEPYARVLACRESALPFLGQLVKNSEVPLLIRLSSDMDKLSDTASGLYRKERIASAIYRRALYQKTGCKLSDDAKQPFRVLK